jgi:hypothetical protein
MKVNGTATKIFCVDKSVTVVWTEGTNAADFTVKFQSTPFGENQFAGFKTGAGAASDDQGTVANPPKHGCYKFSVLQNGEKSYSEDPIVVVNGVGGNGSTSLPPLGMGKSAGQPQK